MLNHWRTTELASMVAPYAVSLRQLIFSLDLVVENAAWRPGDGSRGSSISWNSVQQPSPFCSLYARQSSPDIPAVNAGFAGW